jgi:F0F1-type ATP synthase membrane subunit b/b'
MLEKDMVEIPGEEDEQETEIDLDAPAPEQSLEEEQIDVEEDNTQSDNSSEKPDERKDVQTSEQKELGEYSEGVQKRIAKLTRKMREAERQKEEAIAYAQQINQQAQKMKGRYDKLGDNYTKELEQKVTAGMAAAKAELKAATESQDVDRQVEAQKAIAQLAMEETRLGQLKNVQEERLSRKTETQEQPVNYQNYAQQMPTTQDLYQAAQQIDPKAETWSAKNSWFGTDNAMTYTAFDIHRKLVEEEGYDTQSDDYYNEVDRRIRLEFPHKFDKVESTTSEQPVQNVASAKRPATKGRRKTVKLTPSQIAISKRLGVPLEEYAKQLAAKEV